MRSNDAFTLIEVMMVAAVLAILAAVLAPMVVHKLHKADITAAQSGANAIIKAIESFRSDTKEYPDSGEHDVNPDYYHYLYTDGSTPVMSGVSWGSQSDSITNHLVLNSPDGDSSYGETGDDYPSWNQATLSGWHGPYLSPGNSADPWGNRYSVNVWAFWKSSAPTVYGWIISAGSDGTLDTDDGDNTIQNDDVGTWIASAP